MLEITDPAVAAMAAETADRLDQATLRLVILDTAGLVDVDIPPILATNDELLRTWGDIVQRLHRKLA